METNQKKGHNRKAFHLKKHRKADDSRSFDPRPTNREETDEKPVLFQLGSIASYGVVSDVPLKADPEITTSRSPSPSMSSSSPTSSGKIVEVNAKGRKFSLSFDSSAHNKELLSLSLKLCELQGSSDTPRSQVSGVTHASVEPALLSPSVQTMDREGSDESQTNSLPTLEKNLSTVSNESLFSLSIGENAIARDELFSYRDFKAGEVLKSGELLSFSPSVHVPVDSYDMGKSFDMEEKVSGTLQTDSEDKSSNSNVSWRNIGECNNSDEAPSSTQSVSYPITKKNKKKKKAKKKKAMQHQQQQKQKKRCSWLCCKNTGSCFSCCRWPSCDYDFSCCKRIKCCSCCCRWPKCGCSSCGWLLCCHWSCWSCCSSSLKKVIDDEMTRGSEEQKLQKPESKTPHKWFCCFPSCSSFCS
ncbi:uncharacterized protein LOC18008233 [Eutrema salsugineum]|uniref:uncharacterized protein LOC18008233 n=1 Tax=Eutrema salsugineum TaxID=72664 RepID=UPI000CED7F47|nr:uncharacterized protein LOC18008233 [Eutrema salsugineum]